MAINKVEYGGNTLIDITDTTATSSDVASGEVFYNADGTRGVGTLTMGNAKTYYGTSSTAAGTAAKTATCSGFTLETGNIVFVQFTNGNSYNGTATLSVNSTTAKNICSVGSTTTTRYYWKAGEVVGFVYDGTNYVMIEKAPATTTYYGITKLSSSTSSTSEALAATPKAVKTAYDLANGKQDVLTFDTTPTSASTNPVTSGGVYSKLYDDYVGFTSWDSSNYVYKVSNKSSIAPLLVVDSNNKVRIGNLPTTTSITDDSSTIPKTNAVYNALSSKANSSDIPTKVSDLQNDSGFITSYTETDPVFTASAAHGISSSDISNWNGKQNEITSSNKLDYSLIDNTPTIPTVPTTLSSFTDDLGSSPTHTHSQYLNSSSIVDLIYPVGSIYMSVNSTSPQTLFGGTWVQLEDTFLLGAGNTYTAGSTGGSASHTLTTDELPAHTHGSETLTGSITIRAIDSVTSNNANLLQQNSGIITRSNDSNVNGYRSSNSNYRTAQSSQYNQITVNATHEHDSVGNGDAFSTLPPYLTVYMWKRTA